MLLKVVEEAKFPQVVEERPPPVLTISDYPQQETTSLEGRQRREGIREERTGLRNAHTQCLKNCLVYLRIQPNNAKLRKPLLCQCNKIWLMFRVSALMFADLFLYGPAQLVSECHIIGAG